MLAVIKKITPVAGVRDSVRAMLCRIPGVRQFAGMLRRNAPAPIQMLRPIGLSDLYDLPDGWQITGPAYIGVGAPKCGTSWWYRLIIEHPQVVVNRAKLASAKELQYFPHFQSKPMTPEEIATYQQFFAAPPGAISGEFTPRYLSYPNCIEQIACAAPNAKILVILRNPIDRMLSHINHMRVSRFEWLKGQKPEYIKFFHHWPIHYEAAMSSLYAIGLRRLFNYFSHSQILVLQYEQCRKDPIENLLKTYRFLGLNDEYLPDKINGNVNIVPYIISRYTPEERAYLATYFADDVKQTIELCPEIDLDLWLDFVDL